LTAVAAQSFNDFPSDKGRTKVGFKKTPSIIIYWLNNSSKQFSAAAQRPSVQLHLQRDTARN
jgi:hypothetical protein